MSLDDSNAGQPLTDAFEGRLVGGVQRLDGGRVYLVEQGRKRWIRTPRAAMERGLVLSTIEKIPDEILGRIVSGSDITSPVQERQSARLEIAMRSLRLDSSGLELSLGTSESELPTDVSCEFLQYVLSASGSLQTVEGSQAEVPNTVAFVIAHDVLRQCGNPIGAVFCWQGLLKPGGVLILSTLLLEPSAGTHRPASLSDLLLRFVLNPGPDAGITVNSEFPAPAQRVFGERIAQPLDRQTLRGIVELAAHFGNRRIVAMDELHLNPSGARSSLSEHIAAFQIWPRDNDCGQSELVPALRHTVDRVESRLLEAERRTTKRSIVRDEWSPRGHPVPRPLRFLILCHERTGSNLLVDSLDEHRQIACFAELFNDNPDRKEFAQAFDGDYYREGADPVDLLKRSVYVDRDLSAVGFKIFYTQARLGAAKSIWPYLISETDIRIIHLTRRNLLDVFLSYKLAAATNVWQVTIGQEAPKPPPIKLDPAEAMEYFNRIQAHRRWAEEHFAAHGSIDIEYDDLAMDYDAVLRSIFGFLGVANATPRMRTNRMARRPAHEQIKNYMELHARFAGTIYEEYFSEHPVRRP
jgi:LPS sulfotransferase NodH